MHNFYFSDCEGSYMFWLHKASTIKLQLSET